VHRRLLLALAVALGVTVLPVASASAVTGPACIVSLSPSATQTLFAIGAGPKVRAVDRDATWPVGKLPSLRIDAFNPSAESIAGLCPTSASHPSRRPDLVVISYDANAIKQKLRALGVRVVEQDAPSTLAAAYDQMRQLGSLTGHVNEANALVRRLKNHLAADVRRVPTHAARDVRVYYELDPTFYAAASSTFVGSLQRRPTPATPNLTKSSSCRPTPRWCSSRTRCVVARRRPPSPRDRVGRPSTR
jgi:iron complex transport system substrate-binding protein